MSDGLTAELVDELVERVACRVVELLRADEALLAAGRPLTVAEVAELIGRGADYVRDHRQRLGVLPATGKRPHLRFDPATVREFMSAAGQHPAPEPTPSTAHTRRHKRRADRELLPIRGHPRLCDTDPE